MTKMNGWIDIKEQAPDFGVLVLVINVKEENSLGLCKLERKTETKDGFTFNFVQNYDDWYYDVSHWMPIPKCK